MSAQCARDGTAVGGDQARAGQQKAQRKEEDRKSEEPGDHSAQDLLRGGVADDVVREDREDGRHEGERAVTNKEMAYDGLRSVGEASNFRRSHDDET